MSHTDTNPWIACIPKRCSTFTNLIVVWVNPKKWVKKKKKKKMCVWHTKNMGGTCVSRQMHFVSIFWIAFYERFYCFNGDQDNRVIPEKKIKGKMMNLSKQNEITIDMDVVNKNDNSRTTSSSASNWTRKKMPNTTIKQTMQCHLGDRTQK